MTRDEHLALYHEHKDAAAELLHQAIIALRNDRQEDCTRLFREYESETKLANKHWGISEAMWTRKHGRI